MNALLLGSLVLVPYAALANVVVIPRQGPQFSGPRALTLYNCQADFVDTVKGWSEVKREWCCQHGGVFCKLAKEQSGTVAINSGLLVAAQLGLLKGADGSKAKVNYDCAVAWCQFLV